MGRTVLHCDMNNFYASVERLYDERLKQVPVVVCGNVEKRHGIVLAKSEEAKKCGVKTGDPLWMALQKCPSAVAVEPHFERYVKYSRLATQIYEEYTDLVEPFGLDENWLDVTASRLAFGDGVTIGNRLRERMKKELGLTISVGVSFNKVFAKLGSDRKKPDGLTLISEENFRDVVWPLPVEELFGVGRQTLAFFRRFGILTVGDLAHANDTLLKHKMGKVGAQLKAWANGGDESPVLSREEQNPMKSVGHGLTTPKDLTTPEEVWHLILELCQDIGEKLRRHKRKARGIALDCKDRNLVSRSVQKTLPAPTDNTITLAKEAFSLFQSRFTLSEPLRAVTVRAISLEEEGATQLSLFAEDNAPSRSSAIDRVTDRIRHRYGKDALKSATLLDRALPDSHGYVPFRGFEPQEEK